MSSFELIDCYSRGFTSSLLYHVVMHLLPCLCPAYPSILVILTIHSYIHRKALQRRRYIRRIQPVVSLQNFALHSIAIMIDELSISFHIPYFSIVLPSTST